MRRRFSFVLLAVSLFGLTSASAVEVIRFSTLSSDFTQTVSTESNTLHYAGKLYLKKPDKGLWVYTRPVPKEIYMIKNQVTVYEPKLRQATVTTYRDGLNLLTILRIAQKVKDGVYRASYNGSDVFIETDDNTVAKITYKDRLGNLVTIEFDNQQIDKYVDNDLFKFQPAPGTDIITQEQ